MDEDDDGDLLFDAQDITNGTDPLNPDTDGESMNIKRIIIPLFPV